MFMARTKHHQCKYMPFLGVISCQDPNRVDQKLFMAHFCAPNRAGAGSRPRPCARSTIAPRYTLLWAELIYGWPQKGASRTRRASGLRPMWTACATRFLGHTPRGKLSRPFQSASAEGPLLRRARTRTPDTGCTRRCQGVSWRPPPRMTATSGAGLPHVVPLGCVGTRDSCVRRET